MIELLPIWMFIFLLIFIMLGFPVAFTLAGTAVLFGFIGHYFDVFYLADFGFVPSRVWGVMTNYTLVAVPLFVFMGLILERSGIASDLLKTVGKIFGRFRGSLAYSIVVVGAALAASTGIVGATVVTMGILALPTMLAEGYDKKLSCGVISASGTLGQIIPPSIVLVLLGDIMGQDVGNLFVAAVIPGLILVGFYLVYIFIQTWMNPKSFSEPRMSESVSLSELCKTLLPPFILMSLVLGSIIFGVASPTEAASCGAFGAMIVAWFRKSLSLANLKEVMTQTASITTMVFTLLVGAQFFGVVFRGLYGDDLISDFIMDADFSKSWILLAILLLIFVLGFFLDFLEICFIVIPVVLPILKVMQFDLIWVSILFAINLQTSFLTPPFGFALFYLRGVAPEGVTTADIYRGAIPFVIVQLLVLSVLFLIPALTTWLPGFIFGKG